ncbi:malate transport protein [Paucilactobacillus oligofermentans DSM 15707 = LMG 22743]|uniref:Malate transport protein n=1 Tax=Paucilactobacillus oligofermentans DSM 15707 = LMG 22743 TaxID=1423778 RepID=A0A0R1RKZ6_9LACO|nr:AEC family transporter [Paucilactobacillus oligofermentans]KRL57773.1 malate transport protein [Paucilactobacillus oligofermentans DSM 15707 = LMG 22743]CUS26775.1 Malate transport protein [Paucilactobacillus oligofermentans DSM 15707 = LMG 22743]
MSVFFSSVSGVLIILIMVAIGYILAEKKWFDENSTLLLSKLVTQIALPAYMVTTIMRDFSAHELKTLLPDLRYPVISMLILFALSFAVSNALRIKKAHRGLFSSMFFNSNTVFVGLPINLALFGDKSLPYVLVYYMANTTFFWTLGVYLIQKDGMGKVKINVWSTIKKIFSPPLMGFVVGVIFVMLNVKLPAFIISDLDYIGGLTIPLSMLFIGISVSNAGISRMRLDRDSLGIILGRFIFSPILMMLLVIPSQMSDLMKQVFILQSAMPVMTNAPVVSKLYDADADYAAIMVTETTLLSIIVVPILMVIIKTMI